MIDDLNSASEEDFPGQDRLEILDAAFGFGSKVKEAMVLVVAPSPSAEMHERGDEVTPLFLVRGRPRDLTGTAGPLHGLTSDTTRRDGMVSNVDVAPTILDFLGVPIPEEMDGSPIRIEGGAPIELHERYLDVRRMSFPLQIFTLGFALGALLFGALTAVLGRPRLIAGAFRPWGLAAMTVPVALLTVSVLPTISYATAIPTVALTTAIVVAGALWWGRGSPATAPVAIAAAVSLGILAVDAAQGWPAMQMPVIGGSAFAGARFFGIGNAYAGVLLGTTVLLAAWLSPRAGVAVLVAAALFAGLPWAGSNLGAAITLLVAAGLWFGLRVRRKLGPAEAAITAGVAVAGTVGLLAIHRFLAPTETHIARAAEESTRSGPGELVDTFIDRLAFNVEATSKVPAAWLILPALLLCAYIAWRRIGPFAAVLGRDLEWRDATLTLSLAALVGYLVNDTGIGLASIAFAWAALALIYPVLEERWTSR